MRGDTRALRRAILVAEPTGLGHGLSRHIAHCDVATLGKELAYQLASHA